MVNSCALRFSCISNVVVVVCSFNRKKRLSNRNSFTKRVEEVFPHNTINGTLRYTNFPCKLSLRLEYGVFATNLPGSKQVFQLPQFCQQFEQSNQPCD